MHLRAHVTALKFVGFALALAFMAQTISVQAEHAGVIECPGHHQDSSKDKGNSDQQDKAPVGAHPCCSHAEAVPYSAGLFDVFHPVPTVPYPVRNEFSPDGPVVAIDLPPQLA